MQTLKFKNTINLNFKNKLIVYYCYYFYKNIKIASEQRNVKFNDHVTYFESGALSNYNFSNIFEYQSLQI